MYEILGKVGVFAGSLLVTVLSVFIYSPTNSSNATSTTADVTVNIGSSLAFSLSSDKVEMEGMPGDLIISDPIRVYASTNNERGMEVRMTDADEDTYMRHTEVDAYIRNAFDSVLDEAINSGAESDEAIEEYIASKYAVDGVVDAAEIDRVEKLGDNEWGVINNLAAIAYNVGGDHVKQLSKSTNHGMFVIWSKKANSQYDPGEYINVRPHGGGSTMVGDVQVIHGAYSISELARVDDDHNLYEDVRFAVKIGSTTAGTYTDTVLFTAYPGR